ncbi:MAG: ATP-dependent helicase C-terminal domain-containing protein, partial [Myxococcota bacterium]
RAGRAGRTAPGRCIRLYSRSDYDAREEHGAPEILRADAAELVLTLLRHGKTPKSLSWIDAPSPAALERAEDLLRRLGATEHGKLSGRGQAMAGLPLHPRLAALALNAAAMGHARTGALAAAIASERDFVPRGPARSIGTSDLSERIDLLAGSGTELEMRGYHRATMSRVKESARQIEKILPKERSGDGDFDRAVFRAFSDRLAQRVGEKDGQIEIRLAEGGRALLAPNSVVRDSQWLVALATEKRGPKGREQTTVALASAVEPEWIEAELADELEAVDELELAKGRIYRIEGFKFRALWIDSDRRPAAPDDSVRDRLVGELSKRELGAVFPEAEVERALGRLESAVESGILPETDLGRRLLEAACTGVNSIDDARSASLDRLVAAVLPPERLGEFERRVPKSLMLPSGRTLTVHYARNRSPWVESYLQDFFGMKTTPSVGSGPLTVHLWAPNRRPLQVTTDLESFWTNTYPELSRSLSRRYPKHVWPDDPANADPARLKRHLKKS